MSRVSEFEATEDVLGEQAHIRAVNGTEEGEDDVTAVEVTRETEIGHPAIVVDDVGHSRGAVLHKDREGFGIDEVLEEA